MTTTPRTAPAELIEEILALELRDFDAAQALADSHGICLTHLEYRTDCQ